MLGVLSLFLGFALGASGSAAQIVVAVIDSGVDATHPDLAGQLVPGYDFIDDDNDPDDEVGHGTEMAGIIAANGAVQGICTDCRIMPLKVSPGNGFAEQDTVANAINYAVANGAQVILVSSGSIGVRPSVVNVVADAESAGVVIIGPAGNMELAHTLYPAALPTVVSVVSLDEDGKFQHWSSTSGRETVAAISKDITTTALGGGTIARTGSSVAAARVAGVAGRVLTEDPTLNAAQVRQILRHGTDPLPIDRWYEYFEYGQINTTKAVARASAAFKDVAVTRLMVFPNSPLGGQTNFVRVRIVNQGNVPTGALSLDVTWSGVTVGTTVSLPSLDIGAATETDINLPVGTASATVEIVATVQALTGETQIANNTATVTVTYTDSPVHDVDLIVGELSEPVVEAGAITFPITVRNRGNQDEPAITVEVFVDGAVIATHNFNLSVGQESSMVDSWTITPAEPAHIRELRILTSIPDNDADSVNNDWFFDFSIGQRDWPSRLQYGDTRSGTDIVMDAPWRSIRDYVPTLIFLPDFPKGSRRVDQIMILNYDVTTGTPGTTPPIFEDNRTGADIPSPLPSIIDDLGRPRGGITTTEIFNNFWHYIVRIPIADIGLEGHKGQPGLHFLGVAVKWSKVRFWWRFDYNFSRVLRVLLQNEPFPVFYCEAFSEADRYYDVHVHTIAEQTTFGNWNPDGANKAFGGPIAMLLESSYALGLVDTQLNYETSTSKTNWDAFNNKLVVTDHNAFYSKGSYDSGTAPLYGPTAGTNGHIGEANWYRNNLGYLAGEEITLESGTNQTAGLGTALNRGHHFLAYDTQHFEGPWHGGEFLSIGVANPNTMMYVLLHMQLANDTGFGYAAHPNLKTFVWPPEYFALAIAGLPDHNTTVGPHVTWRVDDFIFKGSQVWNGKTDEIAKNNGSLEDDDHVRLNPFKGGPSGQFFKSNSSWDSELKQSLEGDPQDQNVPSYYRQVQDKLIYYFEDEEERKFIRKLYMAAGTDAHGDFNYRDEIDSTTKAYLGDFGTLDSNAYGRVRTYTLVHERDDFAQRMAGGDSIDLISHDAYREGNTVLTDGPLCKFNLDSDGRHNPGASPRWHDAINKWENAEGRIGGYGDFDGGRTVLVPHRGENELVNTNAFIETNWEKSITPGATNIHYDMVMLTTTSKTDFVLVAGSPDSPKREAYPRTIDRVSAVVMHGRARSLDVTKDERCITNPVWAVPVPIDVAHPGTCPIPPGGLTVTFHFPISMGADAGVFIRPLDANGDSTDPQIELQPAPGWKEENGVLDGKYTATNRAQEIPCPPGLWDADSHQPGFETFVKSYVVYMVDPMETHDNELNDIGRTFVVEKQPRPKIPTVSEWGLVIMALLLLTGLTIKFGRRRSAQA